MRNSCLKKAKKKREMPALIGKEDQTVIWFSEI